jgi:selenocysteine lyase/cysteine desulfurase
MEDRQLTEVLRASIHYFNTDEEIGRFCAAIDQVSTQKDIHAQL